MNRRVSTRWLIVAPTWLLMSSPMTGRPSSANRRCQYGSRPMNTGMALMNPTPAWSACSTYHFVASSEPTGRYETMTSTSRSLRMETMSAVGPGAFSMIWLRYLPRPSWVMPRSTLTPVCGTCWKTNVLFGFV